MIVPEAHEGAGRVLTWRASPESSLQAPIYRILARGDGRATRSGHPRRIPRLRGSRRQEDPTVVDRASRPGRRSAEFPFGSNPQLRPQPSVPNWSSEFRRQEAHSSSGACQRIPARPRLARSPFRPRSAFDLAASRWVRNRGPLRAAPPWATNSAQPASPAPRAADREFPARARAIRVQCTLPDKFLLLTSRRGLRFSPVAAGCDRP